MKLYSYASAKQHKAMFQSLTSLTVKEFDDLCVSFAETWNEQTHQQEKDPSKGGRPYALDVMEDRLFFILFYLEVGFIDLSGIIRVSNFSHWECVIQWLIKLFRAGIAKAPRLSVTAHRAAIPAFVARIAGASSKPSMSTGLASRASKSNSSRWL